MEINGISSIGQGSSIDVTGGATSVSLNPANSDSGVSPDFINGMTELGETGALTAEQLGADGASAADNPFDSLLGGIAFNLTSVVNLLSYEFDASAD